MVSEKLLFGFKKGMTHIEQAKIETKHTKHFKQIEDFMENKSAEWYGDRWEKAAISMTAYDFDRFHEILKKLDEISYKALAFDFEMIRPFFAILKVLYKNLRPLMKKNEDEYIRDKLNELDKETKEFVIDLAIRMKARKEPDYDKAEKLINKLDSVHSTLLLIRQRIGLGIYTEEQVDIETRLKNILSV